MYVVFKLERNGRFLERRNVYWTGDTVVSGEPAETVIPEKAVKFPCSRAAYRAAGEQGCLDYWRVGVRP